MVACILRRWRRLRRCRRLDFHGRAVAVRRRCRCRRIGCRLYHDGVVLCGTAKLPFEMRAQVSGCCNGVVRGVYVSCGRRGDCSSTVLADAPLELGDALFQALLQPFLLCDPAKKRLRWGVSDGMAFRQRKGVVSRLRVAVLHQWCPGRQTSPLFASHIRPVNGRESCRLTQCRRRNRMASPSFESAARLREGQATVCQEPLPPTRESLPPKSEPQPGQTPPTDQ